MGETEAPEPLNLRPVRLALWTGIGVTFIILCIIILHCRQAQNKWHREKHGNTPPSGISSGGTYRPGRSYLAPSQPLPRAINENDRVEKVEKEEENTAADDDELASKDKRRKRRRRRRRRREERGKITERAKQEED